MKIARTVLLSLALAATTIGCDGGGEGEDPPIGDPDPLPSQVDELARGVPLFQGAGRASLAATGKRLSGKSAENACDDPGVEILPVDPAGTHYAALPPIIDRFDPGNYIRLPQVVQISSTGCLALAAVDITQADQFRTGFGGAVPGHAQDPWDQWAGLMLRLVESEREIWLFQNGSRNFWRIDPALGNATMDMTLGRFVGGATSDGQKGAWVTTLVESWNGQIVAPAQLLHLDPAGNIVQSIELPFDNYLTGFGGGETGAEIAAFLSHDVAIGPDGLVWVLHSGNRTLSRIDPTTESIDTFQLDVYYPTALETHGASLFVAAGLHLQPDPGGQTYTILTAPALYEVDLDSGALSNLMDLPVPTDGWIAGPGFFGIGDPDQETTVLMDVWFDLASLETGLLISDPNNGRELLAY